MRFIKTYENFTPIKVNSRKPFKIQKNIDKSLRILQNGLKALKKRLPGERNMKNRSEIIKTINQKNQKFRELNFKKLKQAEYLKNNPIDENAVPQVKRELKFWCLPTWFLTPEEENYFRFADACDKINLPQYKKELYADFINKESLKVIFVGGNFQHFKPESITIWTWDDIPDALLREGYIFQGYIDMTEGEIEQVEAELAAKKYNL